MSDFELIAFDMDGTLLTSDKKISPRTLEMLNRAAVEGKQVVLCTGRPVCEIEPFRKVLTAVRYYISVSGGFLWDSREKRVLVRHELPPEVVDDLAKAMKKDDIMPDIMSGGMAYLQQDQLERMDYYQMGVYRTLYETYNCAVPDIRDIIEEKKGQIEKINFYHPNPGDRLRSRERLKDCPLTMVDSEISSLEFTPENVDKGTGLKELSGILGIPMSHVIAVGDADNDIPMIRAAGLGIAMGNSNESVLKIAGAVVADNDHDGCASAIETYLL